MLKLLIVLIDANNPVNTFIDATITNTEQQCEAHESMQGALTWLILGDAQAMMDKIENYPPLLKIAKYNSKKRNDVRGDYIEVKFNTLINGLK